MTKRYRSMFALLTVSGTAMAETALCFNCLGATDANGSFVAGPGERAIARARASTDFDGHEWFERRPGNTELQCQECGAGVRS